MAAYEKSSRQILNGIISIAINYTKLYSEMSKRHIDKDIFNIEAQARITIGHEIGHGLVDYIKNLNINQSTLMQMTNILTIKNCGRNKEETIVEEFGEYQFPDATYCYDSILYDALQELKKQQQKINR